MKKELIINNDMDVNKIEREVCITLIKLNIPVKLKGFAMLRDALILCVQDENYTFGITKMIYPKLIKLHKSNAYNVENNIRRAIEYGYRIDPSFLIEIFSYRLDVCNRRPTNTDFIATVSAYIRLNMEKNKESE